MTGNRERLQAVLGGADWEAVTQGGVRDEYRLRKVGDGVAVPVALTRTSRFWFTAGPRWVIL